MNVNINRYSKKKIKLQHYAAIFLITESILILLPMLILGSTINWPASLSEPASVNFPLILEYYNSVMIGYGIYLLYSLLFFPVAYMTGRIVVGEDVKNILFHIAIGFAILSVMARTIGIVRWLFTMPILAKIYTDDNVSENTKENLSILYDMLNSYAGGIGENLGVSLFTVIWLILICVLIIKNKKLPNWLSYFGFITAIFLLINLLEIFEINLGAMLTVSGTMLHLWMFIIGLIFFKKNLNL